MNKSRKWMGAAGTFGSRRLLITVVCLLGISMVAGVGTWSVFSASTDNGPNTFDSGNVSIVDDDSGNVMFALTGMRPGDVTTKCIKVSYTGSITADVKLYGTITGLLAPSLNVQVRRDNASAADPGNTHDCTGFVADSTPVSTRALDTFVSDWSTGYALGTWNPNDTAVFEFRIEFNPASGNETASLSAASTFTWEAQS